MEVNQQREQVLRKAFDSGRTSGLQLKAEKGVPLSCHDIALILEQSNLPCISGKWLESVPGVWILQRSPCQQENRHICDVWRESVDGLVMGAGENARYSRHSSFGDPGERCVDVLYPADKPQWRWGSVPEIYQPLLQRMNQILAQHQAEIVVFGYAEQQLFYQLKDHHPFLHGHRYRFLVNSLEQLATQSDPPLHLVEMTPRTVWMGD